ncbi:protein PTST homolog 3, chloroplastic isoform X2 [Vigna angularis]|uniref:protein PTST homolog 3, chloroplastic isoform X2 n=1 Tax=Phaseolus angularis TaxID=3914 RepID=UPI000809F6A5|nr:protein PTST homolog 3, chloroplastic isoform X2 [Vigna angularis]
MGSVWVCSFPTCTTLPCRHCIFSPTHLLHHSTTLSIRASASQTTTNARTRTRSRRIKSDAEICNDVREFLASVGLPDDHIPSTKELLLHGWNDLANIVRRRGHKQIQQLLTGSLLKADADFLSAENSLDERLDTPNIFEDPLTGQNEKVDSVVDNVETSSEYFLGSSSSSLYVESSSSLGEDTDTVEEALANLTIGNGLREFKDEVVSNATKDNLYPNEVTIVDNDSDRLFLNFSSQSSIMPAEISGELPYETVSSGNSDSEDSLVGKTVEQLTMWTENHGTLFNDCNLGAEEKEYSDLEEKDLGALEGLDDDNADVENVATISEVSTRENLSGDGRLDSIVNSADSISTNLDTLANLSLKEKVAKFIQNGDLDPVEDHVSGISIQDDPQESKENIESELDEYILPDSRPPQDNNVMAHGNLLTSKLDLSGPVDLDKPLWDDHLPHEVLTTHFDKSADTETPKVQNESEINHLKYMLYQKELELSRLKEQIEKEKLALSILQTKAEAEISKARKLISEKDVELQFAEESLSGLKEVQIGFWGDGDIVEVAGSFNGWHHQIKLDPQPSTSAVDIGESRSSRFWSTILWLYPGVYEVCASSTILMIKFVVDGKWITDPQRESVTRGHICNNILRVDR